MSVNAQSLDWQHSPAQDFVEAVSTAENGAHILTGMCSALPHGTMGLAVPSTVVASVALLPGSVSALPTFDSEAPAGEARGQIRVQRLSLVQLG